jgi:D-galactarolactone cycloisomerase
MTPSRVKWINPPSRVIDVLQMDIGGLDFTGWRKIMPKLIEMEVMASPHTWGDPLKAYYTAQFAAGFGNVPIIEGIPPELVMLM